ncbi:NYN domain-containing protein [Jannaschia sp. Os4]|nr:NYN domain-containing protein [Jannaschia sp. Os4]
MYERPPHHPLGRGQRFHDLLRVYFYDCPPFTENRTYPISGKTKHFGKETQTVFRVDWHSALRTTPSFALRLGQLDKNGDWQLRPQALKALRKKERQWEDLTDDDFVFYAKQRLVDVKLGSDITDIARQGHVSKMVLIAGDYDFVPAAKLARRHGVEIILDPMWNPVFPELHEHIDDIRSMCPNPRQAG